MVTDIPQDVPVLVLVTWPADQDPAPFARGLVDDRLAACVNVLPPMVSHYRWNDEVHADPEHQLLIKTTSRRLGALEDRLRSAHPYEVPELLVLDVAGGSDRYVTWLRASTR